MGISDRANEQPLFFTPIKETSCLMVSPFQVIVVTLYTPFGNEFFMWLVLFSNPLIMQGIAFPKTTIENSP